MLLRKAPLGDPIEIKVRDSRLSIEQAALDKLTLEVI